MTANKGSKGKSEGKQTSISVIIDAQRTRVLDAQAPALPSPPTESSAG
jgi:hypothetical protein